MGSIFYGQAQAIVAQGQVNAKRITTKSGNTRRAAETDLQLFSQALGNRRVLDAAGKNIAAYGENIAKNVEAAAMGDWQTQIARSEELGAVAAMAAAAGVGGSSVEAYNRTIATNNALQDEYSDRQFQRDLYSATQARGQVLTDAVANMDQNVYRTDLDVSTYQDVKKPSFMSGLLTLGMTAAATYFGGPQAGQAVLSFRESQMAAKQGNFGQAAASMNSAISSGIGAAKTLNQTGGSLWGSTQSKTSNDNIVVSPYRSQIHFG